MDKLYERFTNIIEINNNYNTIVNVLFYNNQVISISNAVDANAATLLSYTNSIRNQALTVLSLHGYSSTVTDILTVISAAKLTIAQLRNIITSDPNIPSSISTSLSSTVINLIMGISFTDTVAYFQSPGVAPLSEDLSSNLTDITTADASWNTIIDTYTSFKNTLGTLSTLSSVINSISSFINTYNNTISPILVDLSNNFVSNLLNNLKTQVTGTNSVATDNVSKFTSSVDGYRDWLDISLNKTQIQGIVQFYRILTDDIDSIDPSANDLSYILQEKIGVDLSLNIDFFESYPVQRLKDYLQRISSANNNIYDILHSINIAQTNALTSDINQNANLATKIQTLASFFSSQLPFVSVLSSSLPNLQYIDTQFPNVTQPVQIINKFHQALVFFMDVCDWINNYLQNIDITKMKSTLNEIRNILIRMQTFGLNSLIQQYNDSGIPELTGQLTVDLNTQLGSLVSYANTELTRLNELIATMDSINTIRTNAVTITNYKNFINTNRSLLVDISNNIGLIDNTTIDFSHNPIAPLPFQYTITQINKYYTLHQKWPAFKQLLAAIQASYLSYIQANYDILYSVLDTAENLSIVQDLVLDSTTTTSLDIQDVTVVRLKLNTWLTESTRSNSLFALCIDQNNFIEVNDWVLLQNTASSVYNTHPLLVVDKTSVIFQGTIYQIAKLAWNKNATPVFAPVPDANYVLVGGIGNFVKVYYQSGLKTNTTNNDLLNDKCFFDVYTNYFTTDTLTRDVGRYKDYLTDYGTQYDVRDYMDGITRDIIRNTPGQSPIFRLPDSDSSIILRHSFSTFNFIENITDTNILPQITYLINRFNTHIPAKLNNLQALKQIIARPTSPSVAWIDYLGHFIADNIELQLDEQSVEKLTSLWIHVAHNADTQEGQKRGYYNMIGNIDALTTPQPFIEGRRLYIPLPFYFQKRPAQAIPLIALVNSNLTLKFDFRKLEDLMVFPLTARVEQSGKFKAQLLGSYIYLSDTERRLFGSSRHEYVIEQVQYLNKWVDDKTREMNIDFANPVKDLFFCIQPAQRTADKRYHELTVQTIHGNDEASPFIDSLRQRYDLLGIPMSDAALLNNMSAYERVIYNGIINRQTPGVNPFKTVSINFNGHDRIHDLPSDFTNTIYPYERYETTFQPGLNVYPFALYPHEVTSTGYCNFTYIRDKKLRFELGEEAIEGNLQVMARSYNILRIASGIAAIGF
jgi:hypothetical protein